MHKGRRAAERGSFLGGLWKSGIVRSTVSAGATTALVATMMFGGGGFNPAVAAPLDTQDSGVQQQLLNAVENSDVDVAADKVEAAAQEPEPAEEPAAAPSASAETPKVAQEQAAAPKSANAQASTAPAKKPAIPSETPKKPKAPAPAAKPASTEAPTETVVDPSQGPVVDAPMTGAQSRAALAAAPSAVPNPVLPQKCGLRIAIALDLSNSLSDGSVASSKTAAKGLVNALQGTPSTVGLFTFATFAPDGVNSSKAATSVSTMAGASAVNAAIDNLKRVDSDNGGTNWDKGLSQIPSGSYDMIVFVTDGNPTAYGTPAKNSSNKDFGNSSDAIDLETAISAANAHKRAGTFVMGLAVGSDIDEGNIKKISGNNLNADYFKISNYSSLATKLKEIALKSCESTVTVVKEVRSADGSLNVASGWKFSTSTSNVSPASATTRQDGTVNFTVGGLTPSSTRDVQFVEEQQSGFQLEKQGKLNAVCIDNTSGAKVSAPNVGELGFKVTVRQGAVISCTVINAEIGATLTLVKKVDNQGSSGATPADWKLSAAKGNEAPVLNKVTTGTAATVGAGTYKLSESDGPNGYKLTNLTCVNGDKTIAGVDLANPNVALKIGDKATCTFTNTKTSYQDLTVSKTVAGSFARDYDWTIDKSVDEGQKTVNSATGKVPFNYNVLVKASDAKDSKFKLSGAIKVENPNSIAFNSVTLADTRPGAACKITTPNGDVVNGPVSIPAGGSNFNYSCEMPAGTTAKSKGTNTATATWNKADYFGSSGQANGSAGFDFSRVTPSVTNDRVTVTDDKIDLSTVTGGNIVTAAQSPKTITYGLTWPGVVGECTEYANTATFSSVGGKTGVDSETVKLCLGADLSVSKNVVSSFDRSYLWDITKTAKGEGPYTADPETGKVTVGYDVTVAPKDPEFSDNNWAMSGVIAVKNPNKWQDVAATVSDSVDVGAGAVCTVTGIVGSNAGDADPLAAGFQATIPMGQTVEFNYNCSFSEQPNYAGTNTATVTWDPAAAFTANGSASGTRSVSEATWTQKPLNKTITVTDSNHEFDPAWEITWSKGLKAQTKSYEVSWNVADAGTCQTFANTANATGKDGFTGAATATIEACRTAGLSVEKTANAGFDRGYQWIIEKSLAKGQDSTVNAGSGGTATAKYDLKVTSKGYTDSNKTLAGEITVTNKNRFGGDVQVTVVDKASIDGLVCTIDPAQDANDKLAGVQVNVPQASEVGDSWVNGSKAIGYNCDAASVLEKDYTGHTNTATISWNDGKNTASSKPVKIDFKVGQKTDETVEVFDNKAVAGGPGVKVGSVTWNEVKDLADKSKTFPYTLTHAGVAGKCTPFTNTAWVELAGDGENPSDDASVTVCNELGLSASKTANASFDREYLWELEKEANDPKSVDIGLDGSANFDYTVTATPDGYKDSKHSLTGKVTLVNPNQFEGGAITATVQDVVDIKGLVCTINATDVDKDAKGLQVLVPAKGSVELPYTCEGVPAEADYSGSNTVNVSWTNAKGETATTSAIAPVEFKQVGSKNHEVQVFDDKAGAVEEPELLGTAIWNAEKNPTKFTYQLDFANTDDAALNGTCTEYTNVATIPAAEKSASETVQVCIQVGAPTVEKTVTGTSQNADGTWNITYNVVVTGDDSLIGRYSLSDTLKFGENIKVNNASWTGPAGANGAWETPNQERTADLATNQRIDAKAVDTYTVSVNAAVGAGVVGSDAANCELEKGEEGTGFLNTVTLAVNGDKSSAEDCAAPTQPSVGKKFVSATQQEDASWVVKYNLTVDNSKGLDGFYDLADNPDFAEGIVINGRTVNAPEGVTVTGTLENGVIVEKQAVKAGETHAYHVQFAVTVPVSGIAKDELTCEDGTQGRGFFNEAVLTSGSDDIVTSDCGNVVEGGVPSIDKTVTGTVQNADGSWTVTYDVTVKANADFVTKYDLVDELKFGEGININSASWTGASNGEFVAGKADLAKGKTLAAGAADDVYTVSVNATVPVKVAGTEAANCELAEGEKGTGFLNTVTISADGWNDSAQDCATPTKMSFDKTAVGTEQQADLSWNVAYLLTVDNTDGHAGVYSLKDTPSFSQGVTINKWSVQATDASTPVTGIDGEKYTNGEIATKQEIGANAKHVYRVTFNVDLALGKAIENATCQDGEASNGFFNSAALTVGEDAQTGADCIDIPVIAVPTVDKTVTGSSQDAEGNWVVTYEVTVAGDADYPTKYSLVDTLRFGAGATIKSASWTGPADTSGTWEAPGEDRTAELANNRVLAAGVTDTYTVTVVANVAKGSIGTPAMDCKPVEGEEGNTGFLNTVKLSHDGTTIGEGKDCATPVAPTFDKQAQELVQHNDADGNWDGTWDASYKLTVANPAAEGQGVNYSLNDTPQFAGGVTINDRKVVSEGGTVNTDWNGKDSKTDVVANQVALEAGATHTYAVTVNVSLGADIATGERVCASPDVEGGKGLLNSGTLTSGNESITDADCLEIPAPEANVVKTATGATENADGTWVVGYTVVVNNNSDVATRYDLTDTLRFGKGLNVTEASWKLNDTVSGAWETPGTEKSDVMAEGRSLEARSSETYTVTVKVSPEAGAVGSAAATCEIEETPHDRGFLNEATLSSNGSTTQSRDCVTPVKNPRSYSMVKTSDSASGETVWPGEEIAYTLTVRNTGEFVYTGAVVTDEMSGWQQAATFKEGSLKLSGGASVIDGSKMVWTVGDLAVGESKTLTYTVTVNAEAWDQILVNVASGNGDVPPSVTTHPTPEYHKLPEPPVVEEPEKPVVEKPTPELPGTDTEIPETPGTATQEPKDPQLPGKETQVPPRKPVVPLAKTGASNATLWIVGSGALVMLLGAGLVVASRRRKADEN